MTIRASATSRVAARMDSSRSPRASSATEIREIYAALGTNPPPHGPRWSPRPTTGDVQLALAIGSLGNVRTQTLRLFSKASSNAGLRGSLTGAAFCAGAKRRRDVIMQCPGLVVVEAWCSTATGAPARRSDGWSRRRITPSG